MWGCAAGQAECRDALGPSLPWGNHTQPLRTNGSRQTEQHSGDDAGYQRKSLSPRVPPCCHTCWPPQPVCWESSGYRLQPGAEGRWRAGTESLGRTQEDKDLLGTVGTGDQAPVTSTQPLLGKCHVVAKLCRVPCASCLHSLMFQISSVSGPWPHAASTPGGLSDRAVIGEFPG